LTKQRVYELARDLGMDTRTLLAHLKSRGEFVRSASSVVEPATVRALHAQHATGGLSTQSPSGPRPAIAPTRPSAVVAQRRGRDDTDLFTVAAQRMARERNPRQRYHRGAIAPYTKLLLDTVVLRERPLSKRDFPPTVGEVERAAQLSKTWAMACFEHAEAALWLEYDAAITADVAAECQRAGLTPQDVDERVWYGRFHGQRHRLLDQIVAGDITAADALAQLRQARTERGEARGGA